MLDFCRLKIPVAFEPFGAESESADGNAWSMGVKEPLGGGGVTSVPTEATLRPGTTGSSITDLQKALNQLGYDVGTADGNYGAATTAAVTAFQKDKGLTQDGVAGPTTLAAINTALAAG